MQILSTKLYMDVPAGPQKLDFLCTNFLNDYPPINIPFSIQKHQVLPNLGVFLQ